MLSEIDPSINAIVNYFAQTKSRLDNDEVLYKDHQAYQKALGDYWAEATKIKGLFEALKLELEKAKESERKANARADRMAEEKEQLWQKHEQLLLLNREYRRDYTSKPVREVVKIVPMRNQPRDAYDLKELGQITENLIFRKMHDPNYCPDELFDKKYKSKLKTTLHLDP